MNKNIEFEYLYIKIIFFLRYLADAMFYSFTAIFLASINLKEGIIGNIQSITTITCLLVNPLWSIIAKDNKIKKLLLIILSIIEGTLLIIYSNLTTVEIIMVVTSLLAIAASPYYTILDGHASSFCEQNNKVYSNIRVNGSLAYMIGTAVGGLLIDLIGFKVTFSIAGLLFILVGIMAKFLKNIEIKKEEKIKEDSFKEILKNKKFIIYMISYILVVTMSTIGDNYVSLLFTKELNYTVTEYSFIFSLIVVVEIITMLIVGKFINKIDLKKVIILSSIFYFFRAFLISFTTLPSYILIPIACLRGIGWGLILAAHFKYLINLVGLNNATRAAFIVTIFASIFNFTISNFIGYVFEGIGYNYTYKIISLIVLLGSIIFTISTKKEKNYEVN